MKQLITVLLFCLPLLASEATVKQLFSVQTVKVKEEKKAFSLKNYGYVTADDARIYDVTPRFGGYITTLYADKIYQKVAKGERLARVYSPDILQSKEDYVNALSYDKKRSSPEMVKSAREKLALLDLPEAEINALKKRGHAKEESYIYAPAGGYLFEKNVNNLGAFNAKQKLFTIVDLQTVWIEVKIYQKDLYRYHELNDFSVKAVGVEQPFKARKLQFYPNIDPKEATATLRLEADNEKGKLLPGMYAAITASGSAESYLTLPSTAVIRKNGTFYVFGIGEFEGEYAPMAIDAEMLDNNTYIIKSGLNKGDEVVNNALFMMDSDAQINDLY
ncbi:MAG: efflux RND transporter periplasmic adaptor subunit [Helicobacteraceae bacterium]|jgi:Cu(I)/Ag(I) efflux system membrane fusion protein|nr:efflux RND transporter periplasmic adaptor subunit [Helicobacteraceae bacterium]